MTSSSRPEPDRPGHIRWKVLASLVVSRDAQSVVMANVYPGVLPGVLAEVGLWLTVSHDGAVALGVGTRRTLGLGLGLDVRSR